MIPVSMCLKHRRFAMSVATVIASLACMGLFASTASADVPDQLTHQGRLLNDQGEPATGTKTLEFAIYDSKSGGAVLWEGEPRIVELGDKGFYSVTLGGDSNPLDAEALEGGERWLEIAVDETTMSPRMALDSVPYAALAAKSESVAEGAVDSSALAEGAVDSSALADGSVGSSAVSSDFRVDWNDVSNRPDGLDDGDNDTLAGLSCQAGYLLEYNGSNWGCVDRPSLAGKQCASGQVARGYRADGTLICAQDQTLSESEVDQFASNSGYVKQSDLSNYVKQSTLSNYAQQSSLSNYAEKSTLSNYAQKSTLSNYAQKSNLSNVATSGDFADLNNVPQGLSDGDQDTTYQAGDGLSLDSNTNTFSADKNQVQTWADESASGKYVKKNNGKATDLTTEGTVDAQDGVKLGSTSNCNSNAKGTMRFASGEMQYCDGSNWQSIPTKAYHQPEHGAETDELYHFAIDIPGAGDTGTAAANRIMHCAPMTDDNEPYQFKSGGHANGWESAYIAGFATDHNGHCMSGEESDWNKNNNTDECVSLLVTNWDSESHEGFGAWCRKYPGSSNAETEWAQINVANNQYRSSTGRSESISKPANVGDIECTNSGLACVKRVR